MRKLISIISVIGLLLAALGSLLWAPVQGVLANREYRRAHGLRPRPLESSPLAAARLRASLALEGVLALIPYLRERRLERRLDLYREALRQGVLPSGMTFQALQQAYSAPANIALQAGLPPEIFSRRDTKAFVGFIHADGTYAAVNVTLGAAVTQGATSLTLFAAPSKPLQKGAVIKFGNVLVIVDAEASGTTVAIKKAPAAIPNGTNGTWDPLPQLSASDQIDFQGAQAQSKDVPLYGNAVASRIFTGSNQADTSVSSLSPVTSDPATLQLQVAAEAPTVSDKTRWCMILLPEGDGYTFRVTVGSVGYPGGPTDEFKRVFTLQPVTPPRYFTPNGEYLN